MDVNKDFLAVSTSAGFVKLWRQGRAGPVAPPPPPQSRASPPRLFFFYSCSLHRRRALARVFFLFPLGRASRVDEREERARASIYRRSLVWRLGGRSPKSHGPTGGKKIDAQAQGVPEDSTIESIRVNCNGTKISVLFSLPGSATTHTVIAVYDVDSDALRTFDFEQTGRVPESHSWDNSVPMMFGVQTVAVG